MKATHLTPVLPPEVWNPVVRSFRDWMAPCTEAPDEFMFASAFVTLGLAIGRDVYVNMGRRLYANAMVAIIGPAAIHKGTPWALIDNEVLGPDVDLGQWRLTIVRGTGSAEGLLERFMEQTPEEGAKGRSRWVLRRVPERRVLTVEEELGYFLVKSHCDATANLREITCQLWDGVDVSPPTRSRSLSGRVDADRFHKSLRALIELGIVESDPSGEYERPRFVRAKLPQNEAEDVDGRVDAFRS